MRFFSGLGLSALAAVSGFGKIPLTDAAAFILLDPGAGTGAAIPSRRVCANPRTRRAARRRHRSGRRRTRLRRRRAARART